MLYQSDARLPPDEREDSKLRIEFRTQIQDLHIKLGQVARTDALKAFDENHRAPTLGWPFHGRLTSEQLAHELLLDQTFQLDESGSCSIDNPMFYHIRDSIQRAFWDSHVDDLQLAIPCYARVLRVLAEIRDGIADLWGSNELHLHVAPLVPCKNK